MSELIRTDTVLGKQQVIAGSSDKEFVIQTKGKVKVQQGNRFIDLLKDGKISFPDIITKYKTKADFPKKTGFYYSEEDNAVFAVLDGVIIPLGNISLSDLNQIANSVEYLKDLKDVQIIMPIENEVLMYKNGMWTNQKINLKTNVDGSLDIELDTDGIFEDVKAAIEEAENRVINRMEYTERGYSDLKETLDMMFDPSGNYFTELIKPLAVETAYLVVASESQQFNLIDIRFKPNKNGETFSKDHWTWTKVTTSPYGQLRHNTVGKTWNLYPTLDKATNSYNTSISSPLTNYITYNLSALGSDTTPFYVYARCNKENTEDATFVISTEQRIVEPKDDLNYYWFWVGVINSVTENGDNSYRSFNCTYGFTEISGETITTGVIKDQKGKFIIDLNEGTISGYSEETGEYTNYATMSWANGEISAVAAKIDETNNIINSAGWITKAEGNLLWVKASSESGPDIISYINQTASEITINAAKVNLKGVISFSYLDSDLQNNINNKVTQSSFETALLGYVTTGNFNAVIDTLTAKDSDITESLKNYLLASELSTAVSKLGYTTLEAVKGLGYTTLQTVKDQGYTTLTEVANQGYINSTSSTTIANTVVNNLWDALTTGTTTIYKGVISTNFIDVDTITTNLITSEVTISKWIIADGVKIGGFVIDSNCIKVNGVGFSLNPAGSIIFNHDNKYAALGSDSISIATGIDPLLMLWNQNTETTSNMCIYSRCDGYLSSGVPTKNLVLQYVNGSWNNQIAFGAKYYTKDGAGAGFPRAYIYIENIPFDFHLDKTPSGKPVYWDSSSKVLYVTN